MTGDSKLFAIDKTLSESGNREGCPYRFSAILPEMSYIGRAEKSKN